MLLCGGRYGVLTMPEVVHPGFERIERAPEQGGGAPEYGRGNIGERFG